jgi:uncharacterized DUF497 family protein
MHARFIMDFEWDSEKAEANWRKHHVDFELAAQVFFDPHRIEKPDAGHDCGEERWQTIGMAASSAILMVVYTERGMTGEIIRLISARKANRHEQKAYREILPRPE